MTPGTGWTSLASADLLLSLRAPLGWQVRAPDEFHLVLAAEPGTDGHQPTLGFVLGEPEEPGPSWFESFVAAVGAQLTATIGAYESLGAADLTLSSNAQVHVERFRQHADGAPPTSHLQAYIWASSYRMYLVDGATLRADEDRDLPLFEEILRSVRLLPPRL